MNKINLIIKLSLVICFHANIANLSLFGVKNRLNPIQDQIERVRKAHTLRQELLEIIENIARSGNDLEGASLSKKLENVRSEEDPRVLEKAIKYDCLHKASQSNLIPIANILIENGASVTALDAQGQQPIYYALRHPDLRLCNILLEEIETKDPSLLFGLSGAMRALKQLDATAFMLHWRHLFIRSNIHPDNPYRISSKNLIYYFKNQYDVFSELNKDQKSDPLIYFYNFLRGAIISNTHFTELCFCHLLSTKTIKLEQLKRFCDYIIDSLEQDMDPVHARKLILFLLSQDESMRKDYYLNKIELSCNELGIRHQAVHLGALLPIARKEHFSPYLMHGQAPLNLRLNQDERASLLLQEVDLLETFSKAFIDYQTFKRYRNRSEFLNCH